MSRFSVVRTQDNCRATSSHVLFKDIEIGRSFTANTNASDRATDPFFIRAMIANTGETEPTRAYQQSACRQLLDAMLAEGPFSGDRYEDRRAWTVSRSECGSPNLLFDGLPSELKLSMAHSGPWIAVTVAMGADVGIDVEESKPRKNFAAMAKYMGWENRVDDVHGFLSLWTLWEACVKLEKSSIFSSQIAAFNVLERITSRSGLAETGAWAGLRNTIPEGAHFALAIRHHHQAPLEIKGY